MHDRRRACYMTRMEENCVFPGHDAPCMPVAEPRRRRQGSCAGGQAPRPRHQGAWAPTAVGGEAAGVATCCVCFGSSFNCGPWQHSASTRAQLDAARAARRQRVALVVMAEAQRHDTAVWLLAKRCPYGEK